MVTLKNEYLEATIEKRGAQLCMLKDLKNGRDLLWEGDPAFWGYHAPVLFPFVGIMNRKEFRYKGTAYPMKQHGFAREMNFRVEQQTETSVTHVLESDAKTRENYPFEFRLAITQTLVKNRLVISWCVENPAAQETLYFSIGAHPAFRVPANETDRKNECYVYFPGHSSLSYILVDLKEVAADPSKVYTMELDNGYLKLEDHLFDIDTFIFEDSQIREVSLCGSDKKPYITMYCEGFPYFGLWTKSDTAPFVCLEPWYGRIDDKGFCGELQEKTGILSLAAGEVFRASYEIEVS